MTEITMEIVEMVVVAARRRKTRKRKVKTRIESLALGMIRSDSAIAEPTHQNSRPRNAVSVTHAIVATICGNI
jgi:hypothetical protein